MSLWNRIFGKSIENSIYMKVLQMGFESDDLGVSFNEVVDKLDINISNEHFEINFAIWFYTNFHNKEIEPKILGMSTATNTSFHLNQRTFKNLKKYNSDKSYIKGDSLNKYIDFLELQRTRKASINATLISLISVIIALSSIIIPRIFPNKEKPLQNIYNSYYGNETANHKNNDTINVKPTTKNMIKSQNNSSN